MYKCLSADLYLIQEDIMLIHRHRVKRPRVKCHMVKRQTVKNRQRVTKVKINKNILCITPGLG